MEQEERAPEQGHEDEGTQQVIQGEGDLHFEHRLERGAEGPGEEVPFAEGRPQVVRDRDGHADRREEGDGLHAQQDFRSDPAPHEADEHVSRDDEERDSGHRPQGVAGVCRPPLEGLKDREGRHRDQDRPPTPEEGAREEARDEDRLDVRVRMHHKGAEDREEDQEDAGDPRTGIAQAGFQSNPPSRHLSLPPPGS